MRYLFDSSGIWIAYEIDGFVYSTNGKWVGWIPWRDNYVVDTSGRYLGHIIDNRLFRLFSHEYRGYPGYPGYPPYPGYPGYPGFAGYYPLPLGASDVSLQETQ